MELFHKDVGRENNDLSVDDLCEDLPVDERVAEVIGGLLSKVHSSPSHKSEAVVHLGLIIACIVLQRPMRMDLYWLIPANARKRLSLIIGTGANVSKKNALFVFLILYLYLILSSQCLKPSRGQNIQYFVASTCTRDQSELFHAKGRVGLPKRMNFRKTSKGGEGGNFQSKN